MDKIVVITGASQGIGQALAKKMLATGYTVIGTSRDGELAAPDHDRLHPMALDLKDSNSIEAFSQSLTERFGAIDLLIDNAGIGPDLGTDRPAPNSFEETLRVNVTGTVFLTESLLPIINDRGKVVILSSKMGSIASTQAFDSVAYRMSKSALNMYTKILSNRLGDKIQVAAIDPGWVKTEIRVTNLKNAPLTPEESAGNIYRFITSDFTSGVYWDTLNGQPHPW